MIKNYFNDDKLFMAVYRESCGSGCGVGPASVRCGTVSCGSYNSIDYKSKKNKFSQEKHNPKS